MKGAVKPTAELTENAPESPKTPGKRQKTSGHRRNDSESTAVHISPQKQDSGAKQDKIDEFDEFDDPNIDWNAVIATETEAVATSKRKLQALDEFDTGEIDWDEALEAVDALEKKIEETTVIQINRGPVLTMWVTLVAQREGYPRPTALTMGRFVASTFANTKAKSLGTEKKESVQEEKFKEFEVREKVKKQNGEYLPSFGLEIPCVQVGNQYRALVDGHAADPEKIERHLRQSFGIHHDLVQKKLESLANKFDPDTIGEKAYKVYETIRPPWNGWGQPSSWDLTILDSVAP